MQTGGVNTVEEDAQRNVFQRFDCKSNRREARCHLRQISQSVNFPKQERCVLLNELFIQYFLGLEHLSD